MSGRTRSLLFLHSGRFDSCNAVVDKHFQGYYTLQLMSAGAVELWYDGVRHALESPSYWPAFPGPRIRFHALPPAQSWTHRYVAFRGPLVDEWLEAGIFPAGPQAVTETDRETAAFDALLEAVQDTGRLSHLKAVNRLEAILIGMAEKRRRGGHERVWVDRIVALLEGLGQAPIDYQALAREQGMSVATLRRRFHRATGMPLHAFVLQGRIVRAQQLLAETDLPIKGIALELGYSDVHFFTRQFSKFTGSSPAVYRHSRQG